MCNEIQAGNVFSVKENFYFITHPIYKSDFLQYT